MINFAGKRAIRKCSILISETAAKAVTAKDGVKGKDNKTNKNVKSFLFILSLIFWYLESV
jgi:hypothetical protein